MIKAKLQELLGVCIDKGVNFTYSAHVNSISIYPQDFKTADDYIVMGYSLDKWNGKEAKHIAKLDGFIKQVQELN